jgi:Skp family chaperone for outer membrane proteins
MASFLILGRRTLAAFAVGVALALSAMPAAAQDSRTVARIAILDVERVLTQSEAGKAALKQITDQRKRYQDEISKAEDQLRSEERELVQSRATLAAEAFDEKRRAFERKVQDTQRMVQQRSGTIDGMMRNAREQIGKAALEALQELIKERGFNVVLDRKQIVATDPGLEVTDEVMARVNKRLPSIKIEAAAAAPKPAPSAPAPKK